MNKYYILAILCFITGAVLIGLGIARGEGTIYWAVIFPIFTGTGIPFIIGSLLIVLGFIIMIIGFVSGTFELVSGEDFDWDKFDNEPYEHSAIRPANRNTKQTNAPGPRQHESEPPPYRNLRARPHIRKSVSTGGIIFIGPIPILWGSDRKIAHIMAIIAVVLVVIFLFFTLAWLL